MTGGRCDACGAELSRFVTEPVCPTCHASAKHEPPSIPTPRLAPAVWMWSAPEASSALRSRDLATILRAYRRLNRISQERLAALLGYDKTYVSMIETRRRIISDVSTRRHIARTLGLPTHVLGVTDTNDADFAAMLQFGDSTIRLAEIARQSGRAVDAVNELWPLVARLEAHVAEGHAERDTLILLGHGRAALGVSLGTVLPEERLTAAARWTGRLLGSWRLDSLTHCPPRHSGTSSSASPPGKSSLPRVNETPPRTPYAPPWHPPSHTDYRTRSNAPSAPPAKADSPTSGTQERPPSAA